MHNHADYREKLPLHFIEADTQTRADFSRTALLMGHHCELYDDFTEVATHPPRAGFIFVRDTPDAGGIAMAVDRLLQLGVWLPVIAVANDPTPARVVQAIKDGALDYLVLPLKADRVAVAIERLGTEAFEVSEARRLSIEARDRLTSLSGREGEVLDALTMGGSNKDIARMLKISHRTVEIHRANMMTKLGARSAAEAVRIRLEAKPLQRVA